eukprot:TRINITY_DN33903_c0_g1_i1.p1 TRINITY_DN33903_c0_g1~~TRINITY_DN33903_c0_g1_i1.p1  ORF type:complete len:1411 (+),score=231.66 TRINITY_DN33903_c0_g1_i1:69-4301(+)
MAFAASHRGRGDRKFAVIDVSDRHWNQAGLDDAIKPKLLGNQASSSGPPLPKSTSTAVTPRETPSDILAAFRSNWKSKLADPSPGVVASTPESVASLADRHEAPQHALSGVGGPSCAFGEISGETHKPNYCGARANNPAARKPSRSASQPSRFAWENSSSMSSSSHRGNRRRKARAHRRRPRTRSRSRSKSPRGSRSRLQRRSAGGLRPHRESSSSEEEQVHQGFECDGCGVLPIKGPRFTCSNGDRMSFCKRCYPSREKINPASARQKFYVAKLGIVQDISHSKVGSMDKSMCTLVAPHTAENTGHSTGRAIEATKEDERSPATAAVSMSACSQEAPLVEAEVQAEGEQEKKRGDSCAETRPLQDISPTCDCVRDAKDRPLASKENKLDLENTGDPRSSCESTPLQLQEMWANLGRTYVKAWQPLEPLTTERSRQKQKVTTALSAIPVDRAGSTSVDDGDAHNARVAKLASSAGTPKSQPQPPAVPKPNDMAPAAADQSVLSLRLGIAWFPRKARCPLCTQRVQEEHGGAVCRRVRADGSAIGCGLGVCWPCMKRASISTFGKIRTTKASFKALGSQAWWMHEKCMTSDDVTDFSVLMQEASREQDASQGQFDESRMSKDASVDVPKLPEGWKERRSKTTGKVYYENKTLKMTQWNRPGDPEEDEAGGKTCARPEDKQSDFDSAGLQSGSCHGTVPPTEDPQKTVDKTERKRHRGEPRGHHDKESSVVCDGDGFSQTSRLVSNRTEGQERHDNPLRSLQKEQQQHADMQSLCSKVIKESDQSKSRDGTEDVERKATKSHGKATKSRSTPMGDPCEHLGRHEKSNERPEEKETNVQEMTKKEREEVSMRSRTHKKRREDEAPFHDKKQANKPDGNASRVVGSRRTSIDGAGKSHCAITDKEKRSSPPREGRSRSRKAKEKVVKRVDVADQHRSLVPMEIGGRHEECQGNDSHRNATADKQLEKFDPIVVKTKKLESCDDVQVHRSSRRDEQHRSSSSSSGSPTRGSEGIRGEKKKNDQLKARRKDKPADEIVCKKGSIGDEGDERGRAETRSRRLTDGLQPSANTVDPPQREKLDAEKQLKRATKAKDLIAKNSKGTADHAERKATKRNLKSDEAPGKKHVKEKEEVLRTGLGKKRKQADALGEDIDKGTRIDEVGKRGRRSNDNEKRSSPRREGRSRSRKATKKPVRNVEVPIEGGKRQQLGTARQQQNVLKTDARSVVDADKMPGVEKQINPGAEKSHEKEVVRKKIFSRRNDRCRSRSCSSRSSRRHSKGIENIRKGCDGSQIRAKETVRTVGPLSNQGAETANAMIRSKQGQNIPEMSTEANKLKLVEADAGQLNKSAKNTQNGGASKSQLGFDASDPRSMPKRICRREGQTHSSGASRKTNISGISDESSSDYSSKGSSTSSEDA